MEGKAHQLTWIIKDNTLKRFKNAKSNEWEIGPHMFVGSILFYLVVHPKGFKGNKFNVSLHYKTSFHDISRASIKCTIYVNDIRYHLTNVTHIKTTPDTWKMSSINNPIKWKDICNSNRINIMASFKMVDICYIDVPKSVSNINDIETYNIRWELNTNALRKYAFRKGVFSNTLFVDDIPFYFEMYPKGFKYENNVSIFLGCDAYKVNIIELDIFYRVYIEEIEFNFIGMKTFRQKNKTARLLSCTLKTDDILKVESLTIRAQIKMYNMDSNIPNSNGECDVSKAFNDRDIIEPVKAMHNKAALEVIRNCEDIPRSREIKSANVDNVGKEENGEINDIKQKQELLEENYVEIKNENILMHSKINENKAIHNALLKQINILSNELKMIKTNIDVIRLNTDTKICQDVYNLLNSIELTQYYSNFISNGFETFNELNDVNMQDLNDIGITKLAHQKKILAAIKNKK